MAVASGGPLPFQGLSPHAVHSRPAFQLACSSAVDFTGHDLAWAEAEQAGQLAPPPYSAWILPHLPLTSKPCVRAT